MNKLKIFYILSILAAIALVSLILHSIVYRPSNELLENGTVVRHSLTDLGNSSTIKLILSNYEDRDLNYTIQTYGAFPERNLVVPIKKRRTFRLNWFLNEEANISILIYKEDNPVPIENINYYIKKRG